MKKFVRFFIFIVISAALCFVYVEYYHYIFSRKITGEVVEVERVTDPTAIIGRVTTAQIFSFAVAIKEKTGDIMTASSEDRQWALVRRGMCVDAVYYPYPPWNLDKAGTYYNARLVRLMECPTKALMPTAPAPESTSTEELAPLPVGTPTSN